MIGRDASDQYNIYAISLGDESKPSLLMTASVHGTEWQSTQYTLKFMEMLRDNELNNPFLANRILKDFNVLLIPVVNPHGINSVTDIYAQFDNNARRNANDVDLNRDFNDLSQTESQAVANYISNKNPFAVADFHLFQTEYENAQGKNLVLGGNNDGKESDHIRDDVAQRWEIKTNEEVLVWTTPITSATGLLRWYAREQSNPHTPETLAYIFEMVRPTRLPDMNAYQPAEDEMIKRHLTDEQIMQYGLDSISVFLETSMDYYDDKNIKATEWIPSIEDGYTPDVKLKEKRQVVDIQAVPEFYDIMATTWHEEEYNRSFTAQAVFSHIFAGTGYRHVLHATLDSLDWEGLGDEYKIDMFKKAIDRYGIEFEIIGKTVHIRNRIGKKIHQPFRYQLNSSNITASTDARGLATYGVIYADYDDETEDEDGNKSGGWREAKIVREYTSPLAKLYGIRDVEPIKDGRIKDKDYAYEKIRKKVLDSFEISVTADLHSLTKSGIDVSTLEVGDTITLIDERINFNHDIRVITLDKVEENGRIIDLNATLGTLDLQKKFSSSLQSVSRKVEDIYEGNVKLPQSVLPAYVIHAANVLNNSQSEITWARDGSLIWYDKTDRNKVFKINSQGWGISKDGGESYGYALTHDGMNLDFVVAGHLLADRIQGGVLRSINGNTDFNLNNGTLDMENVDFTLGRGADIHFRDKGNKIYFNKYDSKDGFWRSSGIVVGESINSRFPMIGLGTSSGRRPGATDENRWAGFIANTRGRTDTDGIGNSVIGRIFHVRNETISFDKGFEFDLTGSVVKFKPLWYSSKYSYQLGEGYNAFDRAYIHNIYGVDININHPGTSRLGYRFENEYPGNRNAAFRPHYGSELYYNLGTSTHVWRHGYINVLHYNDLEKNSSRDFKENISELDVEDALDYVKNTDIKTYYYKEKNDDKPRTIYDINVGIIHEEINMENDYMVKASEKTINQSNITFLIQAAVKHNLNEIERLNEEVNDLKEIIKENDIE